jgi:hypothetical protein
MVRIFPQSLWQVCRFCGGLLRLTVSFQNASFELYGKSIPGTEVGGDLIVVIESPAPLRWLQ